uniref:NAD(P)-binding domain-containing protein n=1 Tax=Craspedostauros australis TaxID=1486917 RepID=A0A7R9ZLE9_9STRA|mmetsp:Transcript_17086/g.47331  ORF Transcript_17086/g.47331 Transcript_17086/m.47331 type:complete len:386 (+) Transcript_17086:388-1545(+)
MWCQSPAAASLPPTTVKKENGLTGCFGSPTRFPIQQSNSNTDNINGKKEGEAEARSPSLERNSQEELLASIGSVDAAVSCVGNVDPTEEWIQLFGLGFDDDRLRYENGRVNEIIVDIAQAAGARHFVFVSVSYEAAKALEGPIEGYLDGKRQAEHAACSAFGKDGAIVIGPQLVYGGKRFPVLGKLYRCVVESPPARSYVRTNDFLRGLSSAPVEDWLGKMLFSSPVDVAIAARVIAAGALGMVDRDMVGDRRQGFFDSNGKPVLYDNMIFVDGTGEIERVDGLVSREITARNQKELDRSSPPADDTAQAPASAPPSRSTKEVNAMEAFIDPGSISRDDATHESTAPIWEGALNNKSQYLRPLPSVAAFAFIVWGIATGQFVQVA